MKKMEKHIRLRISESQARFLADFLVEEQRTKSAIIRDALNRYIVENKSAKGNRKGDSE